MGSNLKINFGPSVVRYIATIGCGQFQICLQNFRNITYLNFWKVLPYKNFRYYRNLGPCVPQCFNWFPINWQFTIQRFPTSPTTFACCLKVKCVLKCPEFESIVDILAELGRESCWIALQRTLCSDQCPFWHFWSQYFAALQPLHCKTTVSFSSFPQPAHRGDFLLLLPVTPCPPGITGSRFPVVEYLGSHSCSGQVTHI